LDFVKIIRSIFHNRLLVTQNPRFIKNQQAGRKYPVKHGAGIAGGIRSPITIRWAPLAGGRLRYT
jgi:hypothetical protein